MTDRNHELDQLLHAVQGLGASASAASLRNIYQAAGEHGTRTLLDQIAGMSALSERAGMCMKVAARAEAEGDQKLAELGWLQALTFMNYLAEEAAGREAATADDSQFFSDRQVSNVH